ncbi:MAG: hypothetical protein ACRELE_03875, partial [Gemmatimonadales bacterium]
PISTPRREAPRSRGTPRIAMEAISQDSPGVRSVVFVGYHRRLACSTAELVEFVVRGGSHDVIYQVPLIGEARFR